MSKTTRQLVRDETVMLADALREFVRASDTYFEDREAALDRLTGRARAMQALLERPAARLDSEVES